MLKISFRFNAPRSFCKDSRGNVAIIFALAIIPLLGLVGASVDYSRANSVRAKLQTSLDAAVLAGAKDGTSNWQDTASAVFSADSVAMDATIGNPTFTLNNSQYSGTVSGTVPSRLVQVLGFNTIPVSVSSAAGKGLSPDNSCIFTLDHGQSASDSAMTFNGAPNLNLSNCSIRSNTSISCHGHDGAALLSYASGTASGCSNPKSSPAIPDIYASLASNITKKCGMQTVGASWSPGNNPPSGSGVISVVQNGYTEYHICGTLTLSGTGSFAPNTDAIIVIENGSLVLSNNANVSLARSSIVLTGNNTAASNIQFPNGNGHAAALSMSPPTASNDPWQGVAMYQDPSLTNSVDDSWGPGATLNMDGLVYLPNANITIHGNAASGNAQCTKFVTNTFTTNGSVNLNFSQSSAGCSSLNLKQFAGGSAYLLR